MCNVLMVSKLFQLSKHSKQYCYQQALAQVPVYLMETINR